MTVLEAINLSAEYLEKKGIESARLNAELLLADILNCQRLSLYMSYDRPLKKFEVDKYREYISRRGTFEPYQYILGKVEFFGIEFIVDENVLIPRQETEILVDEVLKITKLMDKSEIRVLDIGTGSGNIPISLAVNSDNITIDAYDISESALNIARKNASRNNVTDKIRFSQFNILDSSYTPQQAKYDVIVSNPPYVGSDEYPTLQEEIVKYEPRIALTDEKDGYAFYRKITEFAIEHLNEGGFLAYELGIGQAETVEEIMKENKLINISIKNDYLGIQRVITGEKQ
jgi:release factor glutamine methyltransferase